MGRTNINLDEGIPGNLPSHIPLASIGADERRGDDRARVAEQLRHIPNSTNVLHTIFRAETQVLVQTVANVIAVKHVGVGTGLVEAIRHLVGEGRLARARKSGKPEDSALVALHVFALFT